MTLSATPITATFGVELTADLSRPLTPDDAQELRDLVHRHKLVLARNQDLAAEDQERVSAYVGPVADPATYISNVDESGYHPEVRLLFHSDFAFTPNPVLAISLYCLEAAVGAAATSFADGTAAARTLPPDLRARIEGRTVMHLADTKSGREDTRTRLADVGGPDAPESIYARCSRPVLWPHPITGEEVLYVLEQQASHIEGLDDDDSEALLAALFAHLYAEDRLYIHRWQPGDLVLWDNLALQHGRPENPRSVRRHLRRTVVSELSLAEIIAGMGFARS